MPRSFDNGVWTSEEADILANPFKARVDSEIWSFLASAKEHGATDQELEIALNRPGNTIRPSRRGLVKDGVVVDSDKWRFTVAKRRAIVWVLARFAADAQ